MTRIVVFYQDYYTLGCYMSLAWRDAPKITNYISVKISFLEEHPPDATEALYLLAE